MTYRLAFTDDPREFLDAAGDHLALDPVLNTVVATVAMRAAANGTSHRGHPEWYVTVHGTGTEHPGGHDGEVVGVAMRTAPFAPYPLYVLPMPDDAARLLAAAVVERDEVAPANGALPTARLVSEEVARLAGRTASVTEHMRLFECREVVDPEVPPGRLRLAAPDDAVLCLAWYRDFEAAASEQAGRPHRLGGGEHVDMDLVAGRIRDGCVHLWETPGGEVVHMTAANLPAFGVSRIGPVYTPREHRGAGYASAAVAEVTRQVLGSGVRACLFTDQANPTSNRIYQAIGYRAVVDMANHELA